MKKIIKSAFIVLIILIVCLVLWFALFMLLFTNPDNDYYKEVGWNCTPESFADEYMPKYQEKINQLSHMLESECQIRTTFFHDNTAAVISLYNECFTIVISLAHFDFYGDYEILLYYYGTDGITQDAEAMRPYVQFINDFTNYVAYDTKTEDGQNHFLRLYEECMATGTFTSYNYHFDDLIGNVGYRVNANHEDGSHYMAAFDSTAEKKPCVFFAFEGLLKPLT